MKKIALVLLVLLFFAVWAVQAQEDMPDAGMLPDNPLYGLKRFGEQLRLWFTFNEMERLKLKLHLTEIRLAEMKVLMLSNRTELAERIRNEYENGLDEVQAEINKSLALGRNITALAEHVGNRTYKHILVLQGVLEKVPDSAKPAIERVINRSIIRHEIAVEKILERINKTKEFVGRFNCTEDKDCAGLVCPIVLGNDTAICEDGRCKCGARWQINKTEWEERFEEELTEERFHIQEMIRERILEHKTNASVEYCIKNGTDEKLSLAEAISIAMNSDCVKQGRLKEKYFCNEITGTWWIDLNLKKKGCNPACVVDIVIKQAEINWRCTGLIE